MSAESAASRWVLVTGATDGIGRESALQIARTGAGVLVHGRDEERGARVVREIRMATGNNSVDFLRADLASLADVRACVDSLLKRLPRLDVLVNNAGVYVNERQTSVDGYEMTFAVNHLAPFLLTNLLLPLLKKSAPSRIINVTSAAHARGTVDLAGIDQRKRFTPYGAYASSKLANILFTYELARRLVGTSVTVNCLHPGVIVTKLLSSGFPEVRGAPVAVGATTAVYLAMSEEVAGVSGKYFVDRKPRDSSPETYDADLQAELWKVSVHLTRLNTTE